MSNRLRFSTGLLVTAGLVLASIFWRPPTTQTAVTATELSAAMTSADTSRTLNVKSATGFAADSFVIVDAEVMRIVTVTGTNITVNRGQSGTFAANHARNARAYVGVGRAFYGESPSGSCTATGELYTPRIVVSSREVALYECTNGLWARHLDTGVGAGSFSQIGGSPTFTGEPTFVRPFAREDFDRPYFIMQDDATPKSVTDNETNVVFGSPVGIISFREEQTKTTSSWLVADGTLNIMADNTTDDEGVEIVLGWTSTDEGWIVARTTGACFTASITNTDISGTDQFLIGWRQNEAYRTDNIYTGYADWSLVGVNNVDGSIFAIHEVAGGGTLSDDSGVNMADAETRVLRSCISATGVPTAYYSAASGNVAAMTPITLTNGGTAHTNAIQMVPFLTFMASGTDGPRPIVNWVENSAHP